MSQQNRYLPLILIGVFILLVGIVWILFIPGSKPAKLTIQVTPAVAKVTMNNKPVTPGTIGVDTGTYTIKASFTGFDSSSKTVTIKKGDSPYVGLALVPNSPNTINWYQTHPKDQQLFEIITGKYFDSTTEAQTQQLPLIKELPFIDQFYRIDYGQSKTHPNDPSAVAIYITYYSLDGKQQALDWLKFKGYDPSTLEIIYIDKTGQ